MKQQGTTIEQQDAATAQDAAMAQDALKAETEIEFIGTLEEVTRGPVGPTQDTIIGDYDSW